MSNRLTNSYPRLKSWRKDIALLIIGAVLGAITGQIVQVIWQDYQERKNRVEIAKRRPEVLLSEADTKRRQLTERDFDSAVKVLAQTLDLIDKNGTLDQASRRRDQALAFAGLGRTFADWATLRSIRGLSRGDYPQRAQGYGLQAVTIAPEITETQIALAYALSSVEADQSDMPATKNQVGELLKSTANRTNSDVRYLAWRSGVDEAKAFPDVTNANDVSDDDLLILLGLGMHFARNANVEQVPEKKAGYTSRGEEFLAKAARIAQDNPAVLFARGYLSAANGNYTEARDYYRKAVEQEPAFPRARNNWGVTFASAGQYKEAKEQFEAAVQAAVGATSLSLRRWLDNLGYASLEIGNNWRACEVWKQAAGTPGASDDPRSFVGLSVCHYIEDEKDQALVDYRHSFQLAEIWNKSKSNAYYEPQNLEWYEKQEKAGPNQLKIIKKLIDMDRGGTIAKK